MIHLKDIKTAIYKELKTAFPTIKIYENTVKEGFKKPSFFVELLPRYFNFTNHNYIKNSYTVVITYYPKIANELDFYDTIDHLRDLFLLNLHVLDRFINTSDFDYDFLGVEKNVLEFEFDITFFQILEPEDFEPINEINFRMEDK